MGAWVQAQEMKQEVLLEWKEGEQISLQIVARILE